LQQLGIFREALHQDLARTVQRGLRVGHAGVRDAVRVRECFAQVFRRFRFRIACRVGQQVVGERCQAGLDRDLGLGAALLLVRQI
jgi:hypothetical protein